MVTIAELGKGRPAGRGEGRRPLFGPGWVPTLVTSLSLVLLVTLGTWQVQRLQWKNELIARAETGLAQPTVALPQGDADWPALHYRPVEVRGRLRPERAMLVGTSARGGELGGSLLVPLERADGSHLLVDLGWWPESRFETAAAERLPRGEQVVDGVALFRGSSPPNRFVPEPRPERGRWFAIDLPRMARELDTALLPIVVVRQGAAPSGDWPEPVPVTVDFRNNHLGYAVTWYGLAAGLIAVYVAFGINRGRTGRG